MLLVRETNLVPSEVTACSQRNYGSTAAVGLRADASYPQLKKKEKSRGVPLDGVPTAVIL